MTDHPYAALLRELDNLHDSRGNLVGDRIFTKSQFAEPKIAEPAPTLNEVLREMDSMIKVFGCAGSSKSTPAHNRTVDSRAELIKANRLGIESFTRKLNYAAESGSITPEQACLLETYRNQLAQNLASSGMI